MTRTGHYDLGLANVESKAKVPFGHFIHVGEFDPVVVGLTEAYWCGTKARRWAKRNGYTFVRYGALHGWEARSVAAFVKTDHLNRTGLHKFRQPWWWGPRRDRLRKRTPRRALELWLDLDGIEQKVIVGHASPGGPSGAVPRTGGKNAGAWDEWADYAIEELQNGAWIIADWNAFPHEVRKYITDHVNARLVTTGAVDGAAFPRAQWRLRAKLEIRANVPGHGWGLMRIMPR